MLNLLITLGAFLVAIALLITVHELGHFIVARLCQVHVLSFSIGFGKSLFHWHDKQGTEYRIALFPLGGYVKMVDETEEQVAPSLLAYAFNRKPLWVRTSIVIAGPLFNMLFAIVALWLMFSIGITSLAPIIGTIAANSIAANAGLQPMDEIVAINHHAISSWRGFQLQIMPLIGTTTPLAITVHNVTTGAQRHTRLNLTNWHLNPNHPDILSSFGIMPALPKIPAVIGKVLANYPAQQAGLQVGDTIIAINNQPSGDWNTIVALIQNNPDQLITLTIKRAAQIKMINIKVASIAQAGKRYGFIGAQALAVTWPTAWVKVQRYSPLAAIIPALSEVTLLTKATVSSLGKFVTGKLSARSISGPLGIATGAGQAAQSGFTSYLSFLALISISLAVLNILPIPVLDGGHLVYYLYELIFRKPATVAYKMLGMRIGMLLLLGLMLFALFNDVSRLLTS